MAVTAVLVVVFGIPIGQWVLVARGRPLDDFFWYRQHQYLASMNDIRVGMAIFLDMLDSTQPLLNCALPILDDYLIKATSIVALDSIRVYGIVTHKLNSIIDVKRV